jgi:hypothetical protein
MSDATNLMEFNVLAMLPGAEYERVARLRERQRRERKMKLYSNRVKMRKAIK